MKFLKKQIFFIISLSLILISVCSCSNYSWQNNDVAKNNEGNATTTQQEQSEQKAETNLGDEFETSPNESGPEYSSYVFHSFDELKNAFYDSKSDGSAIDIRDNWNNSSELYKRLVNDIEGKKLELKYPILSGNYKTSLTSDIFLSTLELYGFPWVWYRGEIDGSRIIVKVSYVSEDILSYSKEHSMSETIRYIAPTAPNVDNYQSYPSYISIVEKNIETDNGNISALVSVTSTNEVFIQYIFEDMLVVVQGSSSIVNSDIIKNIDFIASSDSGVDK